MWDVKRAVLVTLSIGLLIVIIDGQLINPTKRYCFNFSWMGPKFTNETTGFDNITCDEVTRLADEIPCRHPLVLTFDGSYPNISFLWDNHDADVTCMLAPNEVCASYAYRFDGGWENITYMCTKVVEDNGQSVTSGCYTNYIGNREIKLCVCRSNPGFPCNSGSTSVLTLSLFMLAGLLLAYYR
ncbi:uncharacterized protein LOC143915671 [Arctopsyche grandis]|uniref:uncharacterized protein LOC143915671 n=1 Tax=Arctopsyche grandis TaxID=121162 RepID=UPI00406D6698